MSKPLLSVLTVTFRDLDGLTKTLESLSGLCEAAGDQLEVLVQDGGTEGIEQVCQRFPFAQLVSAPDGGIYDGMNRAIERSQGDFVWFLNGGDLCQVDDFAGLAEFLRANPGAMCLFDYDLDLGASVERHAARDIRYLHHALPTSHQAIMYPGDVVRAKGYDLSYKIVGDYALTARLWHQGVPTATLHLPVAQFTTGGTSQQHAKRIAVEARRVQREILHSALPIQWGSQALHLVSRLRREVKTRKAV